jgi:uncharacterized protein (TIGR02328 family)
MRLWHKDLIPYLPQQQLLGQWRECCLIAKTIKETDTPNHILVNRIMNYSLNHFWSYGTEVAAELIRRGYQVNENKFTQYFDNQTLMRISHELIFKEWHDEEYLTICYYNLLEKYRCGGISREEFEPIYILKTGGEMNESTSGN